MSRSLALTLTGILAGCLGHPLICLWLTSAGLMAADEDRRY